MTRRADRRKNTTIAVLSTSTQTRVSVFRERGAEILPRGSQSTRPAAISRLENTRNKLVIRSCDVRRTPRSIWAIIGSRKSRKRYREGGSFPVSSLRVILPRGTSAHVPSREFRASVSARIFPSTHSGTRG